ncbi:serine hydrolase, partial [Enterobacter hormaechei subsp. steigerwaltii]|nr:serine hydrolase [Enterobacter hormaechei subsp. steigerwaltii]
MKLCAMFASLIALSASAFAADYPVLTPAQPDTVGFNVKKINSMVRWIQQQVDAGYPGMNVLVIKDNHIVFQKAWGYAKKYDGSHLASNPVMATTDTMYDLASNTKMYATNFALQKLVYEGKISATDLVAKYIPGFADNPTDKIKGKDALRIIDILHHTAGFPADPQYP